MQTKTRTSVALIIPFGAIAALATYDAGHDTSARPPLVCTISTTDTVPVGLQSTRLQLRYTEMIGDSLMASFPPESMIRVSSVSTSTMDSPPSAELLLNTEKAMPGRWRLSLKGERGVCAGDIPVVKKPASR